MCDLLPTAAQRLKNTLSTRTVELLSCKGVGHSLRPVSRSVDGSSTRTLSMTRGFHALPLLRRFPVGDAEHENSRCVYLSGQEKLNWPDSLTLIGSDITVRKSLLIFTIHILCNSFQYLSVNDLITKTLKGTPGFHRIVLRD